MARGSKRTKIEGLKWAKLCDRKPAFIPPHGTKRKQSITAGLAYEKKLAEYLKARFGEDNVWHGPWFEYEDKEGKGWLQPDILIFPYEYGTTKSECATNFSIVLEAKLSFTKQAAYRKLKNFYLPVLTTCMPCYDWAGIQVCQNLTSDAHKTTTIKDIEEAMNPNDELVTWCWRPGW